jgi:hypothetical protein
MRLAQAAVYRKEERREAEAAGQREEEARRQAPRMRMR